MRNSAFESKIVMMPVGGLTPYSRNARKHSKRQVKQIAASIERFGFTNPVLIGDDNQIIAGHGRVDAAKLLESRDKYRCWSCRTSPRPSARPM